MARDERHERRRQQSQRRQGQPGALPRMRVRLFRERRHQQCRGDDAEARAAVVHAEHQPGAARQARCRARAASNPPDTNIAALATPDASRSMYSAASLSTSPCAASVTTVPMPPASSTVRASKRASAARRQQRAEQVAGRIHRVHRAGGDVAPGQIGAHRRQQQRVRKARQPERHGRAECQRGCDDKRGWRSRRRTRPAHATRVDQRSRHLRESRAALALRHVRGPDLQLAPRSATGWPRRPTAGSART